MCLFASLKTAVSSSFVKGIIWKMTRSRAARDSSQNIFLYLLSKKYFRGILTLIRDCQSVISGGLVTQPVCCHVATSLSHRDLKCYVVTM